jgi:hypothetical protein
LLRYISERDNKLNKFLRNLKFALTLTSLFFLIIAPASAEQDSCDQCKYLRCLKNSVARKQSLIKVYQGIQNFWGQYTTYDTGSTVAVMNLSKLSEPRRSTIYPLILRQLEQYVIMEKDRTASVPGAEGCGYPDLQEGIQAETDSFQTCSINKLTLSEAIQLQPCKELASMISAHEEQHAKKCRQRQQPNTDYWHWVVTGADGTVVDQVYPPKILTPVGKAAEEIEGYQLEVAGLKSLIDKLEKKCGRISFKDVTVDCTIKTPYCSVRMGQKLSGSVCGDPVSATWSIKTHYFTEGCGQPDNNTKYDKPFSNDCVAAGSNEEKRQAAVYSKSQAGGWMCVYTAEPQPKITIRSFRIPMCDGPAEQKITVDAEVSPSCDEKDQPVTPTTSPTRPNS